MKQNRLMLISALALPVLVTSCDPDDAGDAAEDAIESVEEAAEEVGDEIGDAARNVQRKVNDGTK